MAGNLSFDTAALANMIISAGFGLIGGLVGGWAAHRWAKKRDRDSWRWELLQDYTRRLDELEAEIAERDNYSLPFRLLATGSLYKVLLNSADAEDYHSVLGKVQENRVDLGYEISGEILDQEEEAKLLSQAVFLSREIAKLEADLGISVRRTIVH